MKSDVAPKKPGLAAVMAAGAGEDEPEEDAPESKEADDADYAASVDELFDALKNDDRDAFHDAFKAAVMSCK